MTIHLFFLLAACLFPLRASCASVREQLDAVVVQIGAKPADRSLREKAIALAREIKPAPVVPPKAKRSFVMAQTYQKEAKNPSDYALAIESFQDALRAAPWWGEAYVKLSASLESAGRLDEAAEALELYLLTKPKDAEKAQSRLYALEAKKNMAAKRAAEAASARSAAAAPAQAAAPRVTLDCQSTSGVPFMLRVDYAAKIVDMPNSADLPYAIGTAFATAPATVTDGAVDWNATIKNGSIFKGSINRLSGQAYVFFSAVRDDGRVDNQMYDGPCRGATKQF